MTAAPALRALAGRVARLAPDWQRPERFYEQRSALAGALRALAEQAPPCACPAEGLRRRAVALRQALAAAEAERDRLARLLASARPPARRRRGADPRQPPLPF
ncbi:hypothetical protein [Caldovatus aquaticus]|uniref:Uncharacterized protein n=1 Tax=Caldovatus aquaticus TaxID=2865671 RepID=A0ABS7EXT2_9PROT|nr:hypothetical protein [Caldovatus aquaticus]MBW8268088.1 hypothetical protein [Caldovatus aquaticus]